jgi:site-specific recombinase XerD
MLRVRGADLDKQRMTSAQNWFTHQFAKARDKAKLHDVSAHTLRHTCASRLVQAGVSLYEVRQLLGHSSITVTERYAHLAPSSLDRAVAVLTNRDLPDKVTSMRPKSQ